MEECLSAKPVNGAGGIQQNKMKSCHKELVFLDHPFAWLNETNQMNKTTR